MKLVAFLLDADVVCVECKVVWLVIVSRLNAIIHVGHIVVVFLHRIHIRKSR